MNEKYIELFEKTNDLFKKFDIVCNCLEENDKETLIYLNTKLRKLSANESRSRKNSLENREKYLEIYKKTFLLTSHYVFEDYMIYLEINRPLQEQFYRPRMNTLKKVANKLQDLHDDRLDELFLSMPPRVGKLLSDDTPVLTRNGWKNHGDLVVGDEVINPSGQFVPVIGVLPKHHTTHTVTMSDGSQFECHFRHEWEVYDRRCGKIHILETQDMIGKLKNGKHFNFMIPNKEYMLGENKEFIVSPYMLGVWLGDGTNRKPRITIDKHDYPIVNKLINDGYNVSKVYVHKDTDVPSYEFNGLNKQLNKFDMCFPKATTIKHIPEEYMTSSIEQRLELLAGLLDTDGSLRRKENRYNYSTTEETLKNDFVTLISTFGWRCSVVEYDPCTSSSGIVGKKKCYTIGFNPTCYIPCQLKRKQLNNFSKQRRISIVSIEESKPKQGNCITVLGGMYCVGKRLIPTHNTTIVTYYLTWLMGLDSERTNLYSSCSDTNTNSFYRGALEVISDTKTYTFREIFPNFKMVLTDSKKNLIDVDRKKKYPSLTCRSIGGTLNGSCDCNGLLIGDDLITGIEEVLNPERMMKIWKLVDNNLLTRAKENCKILWIGTRWSLIDPIGLRLDMLQNDPAFKNRRYKVINLPALNEDDESNFNYKYRVGYSTDYYKQRRASFERNNDLASWIAQYMGEPIEREGTLFDPDNMKFFNGELPGEEPIRKLSVVDVAWGGGDYVSSPIAYVYDDGSVYIPDVVFNKDNKKITQPLIAKKIVTHQIGDIDFEANNGGNEYKEGVERELDKLEYKCVITSHSAPTNKAKEVRIFQQAPEIREYYFLENGKRSKEYQLFMNNLYSFKVMGKNKNDDAPDSLAQLAERINTNHSNKPKIFKRPI